MELGWRRRRIGGPARSPALGVAACLLLPSIASARDAIVVDLTRGDAYQDAHIDIFGTDGNDHLTVDQAEQSGTSGESWLIDAHGTRSAPRINSVSG